MTESAINQCQHAVGEVVLVKEHLSMHLGLEEGIKAQNSGTSIRSEYGRSWYAVGLQSHLKKVPFIRIQLEDSGAAYPGASTALRTP
ncbi:hypothetical protein D3C72_1336660 [compost metagenome]